MRFRHYLAWACVVACGALGARALIDRPQAPHVVTVTAPPTVIAIAVPSPPPPPPAPPPPPPPAPEPPPHVGCADVATIGVPEKLAPNHGGDLYEVSVSREGCVIAARVKDGLAISWDGGATFTHVDVAGKPAAAADRVAVLLDDGTFGTLVPGKPLERSAPTKLAYRQVFASAWWTALVSDTLVAITDDGVTWRYIEPPKDVTITRVDGDRLVGFGVKPTSEEDGNHLVEYMATRFTNDLRHPGWHTSASYLGNPLDEEGRYALTGDQFWGCGASEKLVEFATGKTIAGGLRPEVWPVSVHSAHGVTYAGFDNAFYRLDGARTTQIKGGPEGEVVGVDAAGTAIIKSGGQLLRWSKTGGWRVLLDATP
jgi:hypothetical protein